jgi:DNA-binding LacI/PurR family transcriptional regulator
MQNIADKAGVSKGTVSYVLNGKHKKARINRETCAKIIAIAEQLGYRRNAIAQSMKTGKTNIIGFVGILDGEFVLKIIEGINECVQEQNYLMKLMGHKPQTDSLKNVARQCVEQRLAGIICRSLTENELEILRSELEPNKIPIVLVDSSFSHHWCSRVVSNDFEGAKMATEYLLKLGHRRISFFTLELSLGFSKIRYDGYIQTMSKWGIEVRENDICIVGSKISDTERNEIKLFLKRQKPSAVFCASDPLAMEVINIAAELQLRIPEDLSIIGFGDLEYAAFATPRLTTVKQPFVNMGRKASEILLTEIKEKSIKQEVKLPVELIVRNSCKEI